MTSTRARMGILTVALALAVGLAVAQGEEAQPSLEGVTLGEHVMGPAVTAEDLKGKVVVFEYWGDRCPPCIASIPKIVELQEKHGRDKLIIVANQVWTKDIEAAKKAWTAKTDKDVVSVVNHGGLKDVTVRGVPHALVFDGEGKFIWRGHPMSGLDKAIETAMAAAPAAASAD